MAILTEVPGLKVDVLILTDDNIYSELEEFIDEDDETTMIEEDKKTVYIESQVGHRFVVRYYIDADLFPYRKDTVKCQLRLDGRVVDGHILSAAERRRKYGNYSFDELMIHEQGDWYERPFVFARLPISEEADAGGSLRDVSRLGTISVRFIRCVQEGKPRKWTRHERSLLNSLEPIAEMAEKHLKGLSVCHQIELGASKKIKHDPTTCAVSYPHGKEPFATFEFRYRDMGALQSLGFTPRRSAAPADQDLPDRGGSNSQAANESHERTGEDDSHQLEEGSDRESVVSTTAAALKRESPIDSIHSHAEQVNKNMNQEQSEDAPQRDSTSPTTTANVKRENVSNSRSSSIESPIEQLSREELEAIARKYRARSTTAQRVVKRERSEIDDLEGAATRNRQRFKASFNAKVGAEVIDLDSDQ